MKTIENFLSHLRSLNIKLTDDGGRLRISASKGTLTSELRDEIVSRKPEILAFFEKTRLDARSAPSPIQNFPRDKDLPLSFSQQRLWFFDQQMDGKTPVYNETRALHITGNLDISVLKQAIDEIVDRHEVLRTFFPTKDGLPVQRIVSDMSVPLPVTDLQHLSEDEQSEVVQQLITENARRLFDLSRGPLFRVALLHLGESSDVLIIMTHHILVDNWSMKILMRDLLKLCETISLGKPSPLPELSVQFADFACWHREWVTGDLFESQLDFWKKQLADAPPFLELPTDRPRPPVQSYRGCIEHVKIGAELAGKLRALGEDSGTTMFMTVLTGFAILLSRYSGQDDILIGSPIANRYHKEAEFVVGMFVNNLVLRTDLSGNPSFREVLDQVRKVTYEAYQNQDLPFEKLVEVLDLERNPSYTPLIQVGLAWQEMPVERPAEVPGLAITSIKVEHNTAKTDIILFTEDTDRELLGMIEYNSDIFDGSTIRRLWEHFEILLENMAENPEQRVRMVPLFKQEIADSLGIPVSRIERLSPLTPTQRDIYLDYMIDPDTTLYSVAGSVDLGTELDNDLWHQAVSMVVKQDDILRTRFCFYKHEPLQFIDRECPVHFEFIDLTDTLANNFEEKVIKEKIFVKYDINNNQLYNNILIKYPNGHYTAIIAVCHILFEGYSGKLLFERVGSVYETLSQGQTCEQKKPPSFYDYIPDSLNSFDSKEILQYWHNSLNNVAAFEFQTKTDGENKRRYQTVSVPRDHLEKIKIYCKSKGYNFAVYFRSLYGILLSRYFDGAEDSVVYELLSSRTRVQMRALGCFYQVLPLLFFRKLLASNASVSHYFDYIKNYRKQLGSLQNISMFLQRRILKQEHLKFFYNFYNFIGVKFLGKTLPMHVYDSFADDQTHFIVKHIGDTLELTLHYNENFFSDLNFLERILSLSKQITSGCTHFHEIDILLETERQQIAEWNDTRTEYPKDKYIHHLFEEQTKKRPDLVALVFEDEQITYGELNIRANQLAHYLQTLGVGPEVMVGICVERSLEMVIGLMGILKAGGAYVPLDPAYPKDRLAFMLEDAKLSVVLTQEKLLPVLTEINERKSYANNPTLICLDTDWDAISQESKENPISGVTSENLAYVIYTSGSTGKPKGVLVCHNNVVRLFTATQEWYHFNENDVWTLFHSYAFDFSVWELWGALIYGGRLVVVPYLTSRSPQDFYKLLCTEQVTVLNQTPAMFRQVIQAEEILGTDENLNLRLIIFGGEALDLQSLKLWFERHGDQSPKLVNMYGITETTVHVTYRPLTMADMNSKASMIGSPIPDLQIFILNKSMQSVPIGIPGEMYVGGAGLARGYLNRPNLTAERFITNPFSDKSEARLYKTGDLARYLPNSDIEYLGRIDHQIQIRGFRVELGEIETVLSQHPDVRETVIITRDDQSGNQQLIAYIVPRGNQSPSTNTLRQFLKKKLPEYMIPSAFVELNKIPLTPNGKTDRRALPAPDTRSSLEEGCIAPRNPLEMQLAQIWENILKVRPIGAVDNFFNLGGHSLLAVRLLSEIQQKFGQNLPLSIFFQTPTIEQLANILRIKTDNSQAWSPLVPIQSNGSKQPFFCVPGQGGNVVYLYNLARHIGSDQPFFSFQALGLDGESEPHTRIEDMASCYIEEMQAVQPSGPYNLSGHSFGAFVAFEMARQLQSQGQTVDFLAILDIPAVLPRNHPIKVERDNAQWLFDIARVIEGLSGKALGILYESLAPLDWNQQLNFLKERMEIANLLPSGAKTAQVRGIVQVIKTAELALSRYEPQTGYANQITLFRTAKPMQDKYGIFNNDPNDETWGWSQLSTKPVKVIHLPGDHGTLMNEPDVEALAEALAEALSRR